MGAAFSSASELREVMDRAFSRMSADPEMGPALRDADVPQRYEFDDLDQVVNIRPARPDEDGCLHWEWTDDVGWEPRVRLTMSSATANAFFQGRENIVVAIARRRIRTRGDVGAALGLLPLIKPVFEWYRAMVAAEYPHLLV